MIVLWVAADLWWSIRRHALSNAQNTIGEHNFSPMLVNGITITWALRYQSDTEHKQAIKTKFKSPKEMAKLLHNLTKRSGLDNLPAKLLKISAVFTTILPVWTLILTHVIDYDYNTLTLILCTCHTSVKYTTSFVKWQSIFTTCPATVYIVFLTVPESPGKGHLHTTSITTKKKWAESWALTHFHLKFIRQTFKKIDREKWKIDLATRTFSCKSVHL